MKKVKTFIFLLIFIIVYNLHYDSPVFNQSDSIWNVPVAISIVNHGDLNLNEYSDLFPLALNVNLWKSEGNYYNYYPYGISILSSIPVFFMKYYYKWNMNRDIEDRFRTSSIRLEKNIASFFMAVSSVLVFIIALNITGVYSASFFLTAVFSFGTIVYSGISRGLWQHNGTIFLFLVIIFLLLNGSRKALLFSALPLFFSYTVRPTSILPIFLLTLVMFFYLKDNFKYFLLIGSAILTIFFTINYVSFGTLTHPYYDYNKVAASDTFGEALLGNLISPGRGMLIYSPFLVFSFYGAYLKYKKEGLRLFEAAFLFTVFFHWIFVSRNHNWWGGHSFGYRLMSDVLPFLFYYFIYYWKYERCNRNILLALGAVLISFYINIAGATNMETYLWNLKPTNIDNTPARNWDWNDPPFLRSYPDR